jgi:hypothetical protein
MLDLEGLLPIAVLAFFAELLDSSLGMGYGTILSPLLLILGFNPLVSIPAILLSQSVGGLIAGFSHHRLKNSDFRFGGRDSKIFLAFSFFGILAAVLGVGLAVHTSSKIIQTYVGLLVSVVGIFLALRIKFKFSRSKIVALALLSGFNKAVSGGGFGPLTTGGQVVLGHNHKNSIGITTLSQFPICLASFVAYVFLNGFPQSYLPLVMSVGAAAAAPLGASLTKKIDTRGVDLALAVLVIILGTGLLIKTWLF